MKYYLDENGNLVKCMILDSLPEGFTDINNNLTVDEDANGIGYEYLEAELIAAIPAVNGTPEHWTDGTNIVYDANDIPTLTDENGDAYLDPSYLHVDEVQAASAVPAHYRLKKVSGADQAIRQVIMSKLSSKRNPLLAEADIEINKLVDNGQDASDWRAYRQSLRDITEPYKKQNGDWKAEVESLDIDNFTFPTKP